MTTEPATLVIPEPGRWLALSAIASPLLFIIAWLILGSLSPGYSIGGDVISPYSPIS